LFAREGVEVFHAKEFFHTENEFCGWDEHRQRRFATQWFEIAAPRVLCGMASQSF
jgi:hypothetical protein